jgi:tetratricopeptide (TPR) repeat protein
MPLRQKPYSRRNKINALNRLPPMAEPIAFKYRAFISYSHADTSWAKWLHRALENLRIDKDLVDRETATGTIPSSLRPIFRDRDDFTAGHTLTDQTLAALDGSAALIVICSPQAAKSQYVNEEVRLFKSRHPDRPVIPLIVGGKPGDPELECFPPALKFKLDAKGRIGKRKVELLAADAREEGDGKQLALAKVVAGLLGVSSDDIFRRAERERRRKGRVRNGIIATLAILAVAATGSAIYAWQQLKTNEAFLTATLKTATEIVDAAVAQAEKYGVPRTATLALLTKAEDLFDNMAELGRPTPELDYQKAWMLIQFARNYAVLGDTGKWKERALEARELFAGLTDGSPDEVRYQSGLLAADNEVGEVAVAQGNLAEALKSYRDGLAIAERLAAAEQGNIRFQRDLSVSNERIGDVLLAQGELDAALDQYRASLARMAPFRDADPADTDLQRFTSVTLNKIGDVLVAKGNLAEALASYREGLAIVDRLAKSDTSNAGWQRDLAVAYNKIGDVLLAQGKLAEALASYREDLAITSRLAAADPSNASWQRDLSVSYNKVGDALVAQGKLDDALASYREGLAIRARLAKSDPSNAGWQYHLGISNERIGDVLKAKDDLAGALASYEAKRDIDQRLVKADPDNTSWQRDLSVAYDKIGDVLVAQGNLSGALQSYQADLAIASRLAAKDASNAEWQHDLSVTYDRVGDVLALQGNLAEALTSYRASLAIRERLVTADDTNAGWRRDLAVSHGKSGIVLAKQGETAEARDAFVKEREIIARLKEQFPESTSLADDLAWFDAEIAKLEPPPQPEETAQ